MINRYGRHYIVGDETGRPRPIVYLHAGWRLRRFRGRQGASRRLRVVLPGALTLIAVLWIAARL
ncbi:hypothetical protein LJR219_005002 [Phenylobacterium sp. LjRoot219]|uniref:hypothetical protein n=1 Tax=Phenylobacterium sp. LjRoot219 TaxID=3342283 RepID=UPI003ECDFAE7